MIGIRTFFIDGRKIRLYRRDRTAADLALWVSEFPGMTLMEVAQKLAQRTSVATATGLTEGLNSGGRPPAVDHVDSGSTATRGISTAAAYLRLERIFPFELDDEWWELRHWNGHKGVWKLGGINGEYKVAPRPLTAPKAPSLDATIDAKLRELEGWVNVFALREEAWRYMQGVEDRLTKRIEALEEKSQ